MKKFSLYTLALLVGALTFFSCQEKDRAFPEFEDLEKGAYPRLVEGVFGDLDYENFDNADSSSLSFTVEFYDENNGADVTEYSWSVKYGDTFGPTTFKTYAKSDFTTNADGLPQLTATFTFAEIFTALGMTIDDFELTTDFQLDATLTMANGKSFTFDNTGSNIIGQPTFQGMFRYTPAVTKKPCNSILAGTFVESSVTNTAPNPDIGWAACAGNTWIGEVRLEAVHDPATFDPGLYNVYSTDSTLAVEYNDASFGNYYPCYAPADGTSLPLGDVQVTESCGKMGFSGASQWGEVFTFNKVEVDGPKLTLGWENDYGEGGEVILTRDDGTAWQSDLFCEGC